LQWGLYMALSQHFSFSTASLFCIFRERKWQRERERAER
jgi:hypothetical protein